MKIGSFYQKAITSVLSAGMLLSLSACGTQPEEKPYLEQASFEQIVEAARGTSVSFYGWGGDELLNQWIDEVYTPTMKEKYDITLKRMPMDIDQILSKLSSEIQGGREDGSIDMIWINGENFYSAKENGLLYGPFTQKLPNFEAYVDAQDPETLYDFAYPIEGYEAPYGRAQLVFLKDEARFQETPGSAEELLEFVKKYPGQVTYPAPPDFTGSAFVRNIIYEFVSPEVFTEMDADLETVRTAVEPAMEYLRQLNPYLWEQGRTFPATESQLQTMFSDGEALLHMTYSTYWVASAIEKGMIPATTQSFQFENGTIGNTNFVAIARNSANQAGALVAINELLTPAMQQSRYEVLGTLPVLDYAKLSAEEKDGFDRVDPGPGTIPQDELLNRRLPEMPARLIPLIEQIWMEEVVGK